MIMHNLRFFSFICIVFTTLHTSHSIQGNCSTYKEEKSCKENQVQFFLKTDKGKIFQELDAKESDTIIKAKFSFLKGIKFIFHGHAGTHEDFLVAPLQEEYHELGYDVLAIDYNGLSQFNCYRTAVENSIMISRCAAEMIQAILNNRANTLLRDFHLIGLSLGGQLVGQIPHLIDRNRLGKFSRITGIDPANEGFYEDYATDEYTLTDKDAELVDVVHTNSGFDGKFGPIGYIDWYPNLGIFQPGCDPGDHFCNHMRSLILFLESIGDPKFEIEAERCANLETKFLKPHLCEEKVKIRFGENFVKNEENGGVYFFETRDKAPYIRQNANTDYDVYKIHLDFPTWYKEYITRLQSQPLA